MQRRNLESARPQLRNPLTFSHGLYHCKPRRVCPSSRLVSSKMIAARHVRRWYGGQLSDPYLPRTWLGGPARINVRVIHYSSLHSLSLRAACRLSFIKICVSFASVIPHHQHHQNGRRIGSRPISANGSLPSLFPRHQSPQPQRNQEFLQIL